MRRVDRLKRLIKKIEATDFSLSQKKFYIKNIQQSLKDLEYD
jgi:hypothetical protein